jgi:hypothetical protein
VLRRLGARPQVVIRALLLIEDLMRELISGVMISMQSRWALLLIEDLPSEVLGGHQRP